MIQSRSSPGPFLLRASYLLPLACAACSKAMRSSMDASTQTEPQLSVQSAPLSGLVDPTLEEPGWVAFLARTGTALVQQAAQETLPSAYELHRAAYVGDAIQLEESIKTHPKWVNKSTHGNVTPLHLAIFAGNTACIRLLLDEGADVRTPMDRERSHIQPIHIAAQSNALIALRMLLEAQRTVAADVDATGKTALHWASAKGSTLCIRELLQAGSEPNREDDAGHTPLCFALAGNHPDAVTQLVDAGADVGCITCTHNDSDRLLRWALTHKAYRCIAAVVRKGNVPVDLYRQDATGQTLLDRALQTDHCPSIRSLLWRESGGAGWVNHIDRDGTPLLHRAVADNRPALLTELLATTALNVNAQDATERTALQLAVEKGLSAALQQLLGVRGIDANRKDKDGQSLLHWMVQRGGDPALLETFLQVPGLDVNARAQWNSTPLHWAAALGHAAAVEAFLEAPGLVVDARDQWDSSPLHWAAQEGHAAVVEAFLKVPGLDVNVKDQWDYTPLHWAAHEGHTAVVEALLKVPGLDVNAENNDGKTPLKIAQDQLQVASDEAVKQRLSACMERLRRAEAERKC